MKFTAKWVALASILPIAALVSCGQHDPSAPSSRAKQDRNVRVARVELRPMERAIPATGTLAPQEQSTLSAKIAGRLERINVDIGSEVRRGDVLAQIEPRDYELNVQQAAAHCNPRRARPARKRNE